MVGGGVIGLAIAWQAATAAGMAVTVVDPRPGHGATWAAAGMLAPVGEAHFGEEALTRSTWPPARAWPAIRPGPRSGVRAARSTTGPAAPCWSPLDASDRAATDDVLAYHQALGLAARRLDLDRVPPMPSRCWPPGSGAVPTWPRTTRWTTAGWSTRSWLPAGPAGSPSSRTRSDRDRRRPQVGPAGWPSVAGGGCRAAGTVVLAAGCRSGQLGRHPRAASALRCGRSRASPSGCVPRTGPRLRRTVRGLVHGPELLPGPPGPTGRWWSEPPSRRRASTSTVQAGAVRDLLDDARRLVPAIDEYELVETTTGLRPGSPDNAPIVGATGLPGPAGGHRPLPERHPAGPDRPPARWCGSWRRRTGPWPGRLRGGAGDSGPTAADFAHVRTVRFGRRTGPGEVGTPGRRSEVEP